MNVIVLNLLFPPDGIGGSERSTYYLAKGLLQRGHQVSVVCQGLSELDVEEVVDGIKVHRMGAPEGFQPNVLAIPSQTLEHLKWLNRSKRVPLVEQIQALFKAEKPQVAICGVTPETPGVWKLLRQMRIPIVQVLRSYSNLCKSRMFHGGYCSHWRCERCATKHRRRREASRAVLGVVGISQHILDVHLGEQYFERAQVLRVIPNAYETSGRHQLPRLARADGQVAFGFIGRLHETKGCEEIIRAFIAQLEQNPNTSLTVAGTGNPGYVDYLREQYSDPRVRFVGYVDPEQFYPLVDAVCVSSTWDEPFGRVNMEALHFGRPVIGSYRGGVPDIINHGVNGWLVEPLSILDLRDTISDVARLSPRRWEELYTACLTSAQRFSVDAVGEQYEEALSSVLRANYGLRSHS